jgi:hypothetical protein
VGNRAGLDGQGHLTIGGRPRFVLGVYDSGGSYSADPAHWERQVFSERGLDGMPIHVYLNYYLGGMPIDATRALLDVLHARGISYLQTGNSFEGGSWRRSLDRPFSIGDEGYVRAFAQHPAALGYYIADEPHDAMLAETVEHHRQLKAWDPDGITLNVLMAGYPNKQSDKRTEPSMWVNSADVIGIDPYPVSQQAEGSPPPDYPHFAVAEFVSKLRSVVPTWRPVWAVLQLFPGMGGARLPTADEMRAHAVMAIVEGAQGIMWWGVGSTQLRQGTDAGTVAAHTGHLRALVTELAALEPALLADDLSAALQDSTRFADPFAGRIAQLRHAVASDWLYSRKEWYQAEIAALQSGDASKSGGMLRRASTIRTRASVANGHGYVFAYNYKNERVPVTFTVPGIEQYHIKVWENRTPNQLYDVADGISWSDTFEPYQAKIYVVGQ